jgi:RecA-family ATPase
MMDISEARELLRHIPCGSLDYQEWTNVGAALHKEGLPCSLWEEWSASDPARYHAGECEKKWRTFGNYAGTEVTMGTVYHMAVEYGYDPTAGKRTYGWDDVITFDGEPIDTGGWQKEDTKPIAPPPTKDAFNPAKEASDYISALFEPEEKVCYITTAYKDEDGKFKPYGKTSSRTAKQLLDSIKRHPDDITLTFGDYTEEAGVWICFNPMDGEGRMNKNVTSYRYALVESDTQDVETQYQIIQDLKLPVKVLVHSGGKSLHAIVDISAVDYKQYQERVDFLYTVCRKHGLEIDKQDKNPSRLSRFPGFRRGEKLQYIVDRNMGLSDFVEWQHYIEDEMVEPLQVTNLGEIWDDMPPVKPELIEGILRQGHKMMVVSSSKAGKTFALIELAISIAEGRRWIGFKCKQGRVLYLNMELDEASFDDRMKRVYQALEIDRIHPENIDIVHLRGKIEKLDKLVPQITRTLKAREYAAVILDPIYKLGIGDENAAEQVTAFCNAIDKIANNSVSVVYVHHHSKGAQGSKASMDRASGSGVFARDADALLDMIELRIPQDKIEQARAEYGEKVTAWRMEATLREFVQIEPVNLFFSYPLHEIDAGGILEEANLEENERSMENGRELGSLAKSAKKADMKARLYAAVDRDIKYNDKRKTYKQYADEFGVSEKTIKRYMSEWEEDI